MMKKITLFIFILAVYVSNAQNNVTVDVGAAWSGYMNWFDNPADLTPDCGGGFCNGQAWGLADLKTTIGASNITLQPNFNTYNAADAYWADGALGNKIMEASTFVEPGASFNGVDLTFSGSVESNTLDAGYVATFWIKALDPGNGYADALGGSKVVTLPTSGNFTVSATGAELATGLIVQYGFTIYGLNANPVDEAALGSVVVSVPQGVQNHVWDFGNDTTNWPVNPTALTVDTTVDGLTQVPGGGSGFGIVESNSATWFAGTANEYTSINRWKSGGNSGIDPSGGVDFTPTRRYLTFPVSGPVAVKIWFRQSGTSIPRDLWVTDGSAEVLHYVGLGDTDPQYAEANYTGGVGNLYVLFAGNAYNLYKLEISSTLLGTNDFKAAIKTNLKAIGNRIYLSDVTSNTEVNIYSITGALVKSFKTNEDTNFSFKSGLWIATVKTEEGAKAFKLLTH